MACPGSARPSRTTPAAAAARSREDRRVEVVEAEVAQREQVAQRGPNSSAVDSRTVAKRQTSTSSSPLKVPKWVCVLPTSTTRSMGAGLCSRAPWTPCCTPPGLASLRRGRAGAGGSRRRLPARRVSPACTGTRRRLLFGAPTVPGRALPTATKRRSARGRSCAGSTSWCPSPLLRAERARRAERAEEWGDEGCSRSSDASSGRAGPGPGAGHGDTRRRAAPRPASRSRGSARRDRAARAKLNDVSRPERARGPARAAATTSTGSTAGSPMACSRRAADRGRLQVGSGLRLLMTSRSAAAIDARPAGQWRCTCSRSTPGRSARACAVRWLPG